MMETYAWILWSIFSVLLIIAEIFTLGFVLFWFGIGALLAALAAYLGFGVMTQVLVFGTASIALTVMSRTIFENYYPHKDEENRMGIEKLPGSVGTVISASKGSRNAARVKVFGSSWKAFPIDEISNFKEGEKVEVVRVEGSRIFIKQSGKELAGWRGED